VTVALDTDIQAARPFSDAAAPTHPSLVDQALSLVEMFGITNVPFGLWVDEEGTIVRPAEVAFAPRDERPEAQEQRAAALSGLPPERQAVIQAMTASIGDTSRYATALRDWVATGSDSVYVLTPDEVVERSRPRPWESALAAAEFELGQHLHRSGHPRDAVPHFKAAHRLDPTNWSYPREAWSLVDRSWGAVYERDLLEEVAAVGPETFYPSLSL
jgi:hypothetical protein